MELKKEKKFKIQFIILFSWFFKIYTYIFKHSLHTLWFLLLCLHPHEDFFSKSSNLFQENENFTKEYSFFGWAHFFEILHARKKLITTCKIDTLLNIYAHLQPPTNCKGWQNDETLPNFRKPKHLMECENKELKEMTKDQATK